MSKREKLNSPPKIRKIWFHELPKDLSGDMVIIDTYAATWNLCILLAKKPEHLIIVNERTLAGARKIYPRSIFIGESEQLPFSDFVSDNEPINVKKVDIVGRNVIYMSISGTRLIESVMKLPEKGRVLAGSFSNMEVIARRFSKARNSLNILMAGHHGIEVVEDKICGEMIEELILALPIDRRGGRGLVGGFVKRYYHDSPSESLDLLLATIDGQQSFNFIPELFINGQGFVEARILL